MIPGSINALLLGEEAGGAAAYSISRSLRFNSSDSAYLSRTPASAGNRKTFTFSTWVKLCNTNNTQNFLNAGDNSTVGRSIFRYSSEKFGLIASAIGGTTAADVTTDAVFRDFSAWYHLLWAVDTTQATSTNRVKLWVNGVAQQLTFTTAPDLDGVFSINNNSAHRIGGAVYTSGQFPDYYLADCFLIDGQALTPSSFTETSATTGQLIPKAYSGSFGTNGFWLKFSDNSAATATTLGKDYSGNSNNWTPNNLSVTAGAGNDSLTDTPSSYGTDTGAGGEVGGDYCTWNPLIKSTYATISNGNLNIVSSNNHGQTLGTIGVQSGKWYWEVDKSTSGNPVTAGLGVMQQEYKQDATWVGNGVGRNYIYLQGGTVFWYDGAGAGSFSNTSLVNDTGIWMFAIDLDAQKMWIGKNGTWYSNAGSTITGPSSGLNAFFTNFIAGGTYFPFHNSDSTAVTYVANFGQRPFAYTAPSGFKALCDTNLPAPVVAKPNTAFDVALWTGNGSARSITGLNFNPDFVWIKGRSGATDHALYDVVRGTEKRLESNNTDTEVTSDGGVTAFNSDGFSLGTLAQVNTNSSTYVGWAWDAGSSTVTNTQGSITSQVRANASAGFSIVTYTGNGTAGATIGHGLGVAPQFVIVKNRSNATNWMVGHHFLDATTPWNYYMRLNGTIARAAAADFWNNTAPSGTVITLGTSTSVNSVDGDSYVAYCFAPVAGYSNGFSYTGNGSTDGSFVYLGFRPRLILLKCSSTTGNWTLLDTAREGYNVDNDPLYPNLSDAEGTTDLLDITSNGFKLRTTDASVNSSGATYVGYAWAEAPFAYSRAR